MGSILIIAALIIGGLVIFSLVAGLVGSLIMWVIVGLIAGLLASAIMQDRRSILNNVIMGLLGSILSSVILSIFRVGWLDNNIIGSVIFSTLGAMVLIGLSRLFSRNAPSINNNRY
jgi:uncharacterized membrane protein YeaQ/YmgE (transglycosylase-associated protein family)